MIDIPIIDTHLHLWDVDRMDYPWLADIPALNRTYLPADYQAATEDLRIEAMVFVQAEADFGQFVREAAWVAEQATIDPRIRAIVAWAPLEKGEAARADLELLSRIPLLRGIRRILQSETDPAFCLQPAFVRGVQLLADFGLSFDLCLKGEAQFHNALELVRLCPGVRFILDHIGKPFIQERIREPWASYLAELAALPDTWCKVSGLVNEADVERWEPADLRPYLEDVFACFGFDRVMFGGDWPVCTLASTYRRWVETLWEATGDCTTLERRKLFHDNAASFYRF